jgi:adenylate kinase family enzyme
MGVPFIELDALHWGPGWSEPDAETFQARVREVLSGDAWVVDGSYSGKLGLLIYGLADTLVWLDIPFPVALWRTVTRTLRRILTGEELWAGNRESFRNTFLTRDSLIVYMIRTHRGKVRRIEERLASPEAAHLTVHRFKSNADADRWLSLLPAQDRR